MNSSLDLAASTNPPLLPGRQSPKTIRALGWVLMVLGAGLSVSMAVSAWYLFVTITFYKQSGAHGHWNGGLEFTRLTFELFGAVFVCGLLVMTGGCYQASTGRRHPVLIALLLPVAGAIVYFVYGILSAPQTSL